jgi:hypothetical protein
MAVHGRAQPVTIISPTRRWWSWWLRGSWPVADRSALVKRPLLKLSFIHFAHWSLIGRLPATGGGSRRLPHPYLLFQSNFNDDVEAYIDAFSLVVPWRMRAMWHGVFGFPGPRPLSRFVAYVLGNITPTQHYYCAYPEASSTMICAALELKQRHERFASEANALDDDAFAAAFTRFITDVGPLL